MLGVLGIVMTVGGFVVVLVSMGLINATDNRISYNKYLHAGHITFCMGFAIAMLFCNPVSKAEYNHFIERKLYIENTEPENSSATAAIGAEATLLNDWLCTNQIKIKGYEYLFFHVPDGFAEEEPIQL